MATDVRIVLVTAPNAESAAAIVGTLLEERLIACGNLVNDVRSIFRWNGQVEDESETLIVLKTAEARVPEVLRRMPELHPYDVPEALVLGVDAGHGAYLDWVTRETESPSGSTR